jgi:uncharacterized damage-inducible protein DinB
MSLPVHLGDVANELNRTRSLLAALPAEHFGWRPHAKSWTLGELATHVAGVVGWQLGILRAPDYDLATVPPRSTGLEGPDAVLARFDPVAEEVRKLLADPEDIDWTATWTLRNGDEVYMAMPRAVAFRSLGMNHLVHHRAQLTVYLRLLDHPVPGLYGPSADEEFQP